MNCLWRRDVIKNKKMNQKFSIALMIIALGLIVYNVTMIDFSVPLENSTVALIGIVASLCAIVLLLIFIASKKIEKKVNGD